MRCLQPVGMRRSPLCSPLLQKGMETERGGVPQVEGEVACPEQQRPHLKLATLFTHYSQSAKCLLRVCFQKQFKHRLLEFWLCHSFMQPATSSWGKRGRLGLNCHNPNEWRGKPRMGVEGSFRSCGRKIAMGSSRWRLSLEPCKTWGPLRCSL